MAYSLGMITDLGNIQQETIRKEAFLTPSPFPTQDSDQTDVMDFGGAQMSITITGIYTGTPTQILAFVTSLRGLLNGDQSTILYKSDILPSAGIRIKIANLDVSYLSGRPLELAYTISMIQSNTLSDVV